MAEKCITFGSADDVSGHEEIVGSGKKRRRTAAVTTTSTNSARDHGGRVRTFPHLEGNFPVHIYIDFSPATIDDVSDCWNQFLQVENTHLLSKVPDESVKWIPFLPNEWHISLSRPFALREQNRDPFLVAVRRLLEKHHAFAIDLLEPETYVNDDRTRSFLAINVTKGWPEIASIINSINTVLREYCVSVYYREPLPHVSVGWMLGDVHSRCPFIREGLVSSSAWFSQDEGRSHSVDIVRTLSEWGRGIEIDSVRVKIGKRVETISLR